MEAVSASKRFLSEPSLETMTVAPQFRLAQSAHNSLPCTDSSPVGCVGTGHRPRINQNTVYANPRIVYCSCFKVVARFEQFADRPAAESGGREGARTPDLLVAKEALSQLSYTPIE